MNRYMHSADTDLIDSGMLIRAQNVLFGGVVVGVDG